ncbi:WD40 repeat-like protein [Rhizopogon vinicolor AM-OR11-026]|uniref:WD40 repeat-like protein n=1 Tax=Rhizopogon vinicolor AM-OR11-026 TaxID=1314800 RepID=A0A1B7MVY3_9AGAM|nr:WD40 repeat-like protein [Rhizopogon vinicolor AM-OR11-026]
MRGHTKQVGDVVHLPDGRRIITCSDDGSLRVWDLETGAQIGEEWRDDGDETEEVFTIVLSPKGDMLASGSADGTVRLWDVEKEKVIAKLPGHTDLVQSMRWSADGEHMVSGSEDGTVRVWNLDSGKRVLGPVKSPLQTMHPRDQSAGIRCVAHLPGRRRIITCSEDGSLRQWNLENGAQVGNDWRDEGDDDGVYTIALSPKGNTIAAGSGDGIVKLWDVEVGKVVAKSKGHAFTVWTICWSADGEGVVSGSTDGTAGLWDVEPSGKIVLDQLIKTGHEYVYAVIYSPDMTMVATGGYNENGVKIWDVRTGGLLSTIQHEETVFSLAWTSDQKKLISGTENGLIRIFDTTAWQELAILEGHQSTVYAISLFRNNRLLASASWDETARLWNLDTNLPVGLPLQHEDTVNGVAISADGKLLVTGCEDSITQAWDVHDILKDAGLEDLLSTPDVSRCMPLHSFADNVRSYLL